MTIVVAGFDSEPGVSYRELARLVGDCSHTPANQDNELRERRLDYLNRLRKPEKAFVYADSLLSRELQPDRDPEAKITMQAKVREPVAKTAAKIAAVDLIVSVPDFSPDGRPTGRFTEHQRHTCGVAFSGTTGLQQLTLDKFRAQTAGLHYTWNHAKLGAPDGYDICPASSPIDVCHPANPIHTYDESIDFAPRDLPPLAAKTVLRAFRTAFDAALNDYVGIEVANRPSDIETPVAIDFVLLTYCYQSRSPVIYMVEYGPAHSRNLDGFKSVGRRLQADDLAVLGMTSAMSELKSARLQAIEGIGSISDQVGKTICALIEREHAANYIGGKVKRGVLDRDGFKLHT